MTVPIDKSPAIKGMATRNSSGLVLNAIRDDVPWLIGGSADLAPFDQDPADLRRLAGDFQADDHGGRNIHFGIREHAMGAIPGLVVLRPADANEVIEAWKVVMQFHHQPAVLVLTRQDVPTLDRSKYAPASGLARAPMSWPTRRAARPMSS